MTKRNSRLPIFFIIGYCVQLLFLLLIIEYFFRGILFQWFHVPFQFSPFYRLLVTTHMDSYLDYNAAQSYVSYLADIVFPLLSAFLWSIFYFILHKKRITLPSRRTVVLLGLFWVVCCSQWLVGWAMDVFSNKLLDLYANYCSCAVPTVIMIIFLIFNILDFARLIKMSKQETAA